MPKCDSNKVGWQNQLRVDKSRIVNKIYANVLTHTFQKLFTLCTLLFHSSFRGTMLEILTG